ncbi:MAG: hypothetical protein AB7T05_09640 [Fimbriimonadaceae bacterium]
MRLCRFALYEDPQTPRSGIYHEGRFYETDGTNAVGVHESADALLLTPVRIPVLCRMTALSGETCSYSFADPAAIAATGEPLDAGTGPVSLELRVAAVCGGPEEKGRTAILGYVPIVTMVRPAMKAQMESLGLPTDPAFSGGTCLGPFIVTPEGLSELVQDSEGDRFRINAVASLDVWEGVLEDIAPVSLSKVVAECEAAGGLRPGELVAGPAFTIQPPSGFAPGDRCRVDCGPLGVVIVAIA